MIAFDPTALQVYLVAVFTLGAVALALSLGVVAQTVLSNRRARLARRQTLRAYYGRLALHH
ncbi:MAG: hypothetical protein WB797_02910 [Nocardioides sp.]